MTEDQLKTGCVTMSSMDLEVLSMVFRSVSEVGSLQFFVAPYSLALSLMPLDSYILDS